VDVVRGFVMVIMALDHVRTYLGPRVDPEDLDAAGTALFLTRWVTHFCAPTFVFLAGAGACLRGARSGDRNELAWFLLTRGALLVVLEFTLVHWLWTFSIDYHIDYHFVVGQVIFATGAGLIALSALVSLPAWAVGLIGIAILMTHDLGAAIDGQISGPLGLTWDVLHVRRGFEWSPGRRLFLVFPLLPWFGVLAAGYGLGAVLTTDPATRQRRLGVIGLSLCLAFVVLRATGLHGDPRPWTPGHDAWRSALGFIDPTKYPPSLQFTLMTLGPAICATALADRLPRLVARPLETFGRVPLFYYLLHFLVIHALAVAICLAQYGEAGWMFGPTPPPPPRTSASRCRSSTRSGRPSSSPSTRPAAGSRRSRPGTPAVFSATSEVLLVRPHARPHAGDRAKCPSVLCGRVRGCLARPFPISGGSSPGEASRPNIATARTS
jgi:uncharacterized membrane protein